MGMCVQKYIEHQYNVHVKQSNRHEQTTFDAEIFGTLSEAEWTDSYNLATQVEDLIYNPKYANGYDSHILSEAIYLKLGKFWNDVFGSVLKETFVTGADNTRVQEEYVPNAHQQCRPARIA